MIEGRIKQAIIESLHSLSIEVDDVHLEFPTDISFGDVSTNIAMVLSQKTGKNPRDLAEELESEINNIKPEEVEKIEVAGPGFINFFYTRKFFTDLLKDINADSKNFGRSDHREGEKVIIEYTDPNPFKEFHIGHLMPNVIGESLSRLTEFSGARVKRASYQGDVGMHVAKAVWGMTQDDGNFPAESDSLKSKIEFLGNAYAFGSRAYEESEEARAAIVRINKEIYEKSNEEINNLYETGRRWSLEDFERIYDLLGTKFDLYFFESEVAEKGKEVVLSGLDQGVFSESDGAIVFKGEDHGLHTRVFVNSEGLPTYEAKELALAKEKHERYPYDSSVVVTGNEINEYFKVLLVAMEKIFPELAKKTRHISHNILRLPEGKMSSRKGNIISGEDLVMKAVNRSIEKMKEEYSEETREEIARDVGVAAIKYTILKQAIGKEVTFDMEQSLSFEGDSGPYLQYSTVRARSVIEKACSEGIEPSFENAPESIYPLERLLKRFPDVVLRAEKENAPHYVVTYLIEIAGEFNAFYAQEKIADPNDEYSPYKLALTKGFIAAMENGLYILGIRVPEKM
ncbi:MAG: arginine--tRNA ligase [Candidatus Campbellbacteria bacterium]|nr:arginine--tRNA ligase [Candidatus Campbellbacteria bacterium]